MAGRILTALRGYFNRSTPGYLIFFVTPHCPCRCRMCFYTDAIRNAAERRILTLDEIERIARRWPGLHQINFSGGDPLIRADLPEIMKLFYDHSDTRFFTIPTSSAFPERYAAVVRRCLELCPDAWLRITQSVDAVGPLHDEIRQRPGLFECVVDLNARLDAMTREFPSLSVGLATAYCKFNERQVYDLLDYAYANLKFTDMGALYVRGDTQDKTARDFDAEGYAAYAAECLRRRIARTERRSFTQRAFTAVNMTVTQYVIRTARTNEYILPCQAGRRMLVMDDQGEIQPCEVLESLIRERKSRVATANLGNIRDHDYDVRRLLATPIARQVAREIVQTRCRCTFECALAVNTLYDLRAWPRTLRNFLHLKGGL